MAQWVLFTIPASKLISAPWYHYIPLKPDYSDLYDIMAFFVGPVDADGVVDETKGHDVSSQRAL